MSDTTNAPQNTNPQSPEPRYRCPVCRMTYDEKPSFDRHILTHATIEYPYICFDCGMKYSTQEILDYHTTHVCKQQQRLPVSTGYLGSVIEARQFWLNIDNRPLFNRQQTPALRLPKIEVWETTQNVSRFYPRRQGVNRPHMRVCNDCNGRFLTRLSEYRDSSRGY